MFENEIKFISDFCHNKLKKFGSFVTFDKLSTTDLHPAILSYISAELDYMIYRDRKKLLEDSIFDYSGREISDHFKVITAEIKQNKKISISDARKLIIQAVSFNVNYVVRPKWSASKLIYNDQQFVSVDELEHMLKYLYYYDYIKNVLIAYISKRKVIQLTITEFDLILNKIDRELFKSNTEELINNALHSIGDFFNIGGIVKNRISLSAVEIFLKEKNLIDYLLKLRNTIPNGTKKKYEIEDIKKVLYSTAPVQPESISGYDSAPVEPEQENIEQEEIVAEEEEAGTEQPEAVDEELEIVKDEKIGSTDEEEEKSADEEAENLLPVEEEFQNEFFPEEAIDETLPQEEEEFEAENDVVEIVNEQPESSDDEKMESEETVIDEKPEEDELLSFYEQELNSMDDDISVVDELNSEKAETPEEVETDSIAEDTVSDEELSEETSDSEVKTEEKVVNEINENDFDLSVFDETEDDETIEELLEKINDEPIHNEFSGENIDDYEFEDQQEDLKAQDEKEVVDEKDEGHDINYDKKIIDEMLEDYFNTDDKSNEEITEEVKADTIEINESEIQEEKEFAEEPELTGESEEEVKSEEKPEMTDDELATSILEGSSYADDISNMIDEIDDLIEESHAATQELEVKDEVPEISDEVEPAGEEEKHEDEEQSDSDVTEEKEEASVPPVQKPKLPIRQKDLLSYLSKKEVKKIISNVFGRDEEDFVTTIEKISELGTYKEATEVLKGVFFTYRVSPYSKEAVILTNSVSHYFRQV